MGIIIKPLVTEKMTKITEKMPNRFGFIVVRCLAIIRNCYFDYIQSVFCFDDNVRLQDFVAHFDFYLAVVQSHHSAGAYERFWLFLLCKVYNFFNNHVMPFRLVDSVVQA